MRAVDDLIVIGYDEDRDARNNAPQDIIDLQAIFGNDRPVCLEIGCGRGQWTCRMAALFPQYNFLAVEKVSNVMVTACERVRQAGLTNVRFAHCGAEYLPRHLPQHSFSRIFLNFSSPLPKAGTAKQRLSHPRYLELYRQWLTPDGLIRLKTDNRPFFEYSVCSVSQFGLTISALSCDLHHSDIPNVTSEYEDKFSPFGVIYYMECHF